MELFFQVSKSARGFCWFALLRPGHLGPHREKGGTETSGRNLEGIHRRFSPLTLPTSRKGSYNIWPSVEPRKIHIFHDIWFPFWHLFLADSIPGMPGRALGSTLGAHLPPDFKIHAGDHFFGPYFRRYSEHISHVFVMCFSSEFFEGLWITFSCFWAHLKAFSLLFEDADNLEK